MSDLIEWLKPYVDEAIQLKDANDGIHNMHGHCAAIRTWMVIAERGNCGKTDAYIQERVTTMIVNMRKMAK